MRLPLKNPVRWIIAGVVLLSLLLLALAGPQQYFWFVAVLFATLVALAAQHLARRARSTEPLSQPQPRPIESPPRPFWLDRGVVSAHHRYSASEAMAPPPSDWIDLQDGPRLVAAAASPSDRPRRARSPLWHPVNAPRRGLGPAGVRGDPRAALPQRSAM
jgi:hypothetical protein